MNHNSKNNNYYRLQQLICLLSFQGRSFTILRTYNSKSDLQAVVNVDNLAKRHRIKTTEQERSVVDLLAVLKAGYVNNYKV